MKIDLKGLLEGINNSIFVKDEVEKVAEERINICKQCPYYSPNAIASGLITTKRPDAFCIDCGCNMYLKTRALSAHCPLGDPSSHYPDEEPKWLSITDDDTAQKLMETEELNKDLIDYKINLMQNKIIENGTQQGTGGNI